MTWADRLLLVFVLQMPVSIFFGWLFGISE